MRTLTVWVGGEMWVCVCVCAVQGGVCLWVWAMCLWVGGVSTSGSRGC